MGMIFRRIGSSYVHYHNWKYQLHGHLFQDRFRSEPVEDDAYFLDVLRYICQNPVKAGLSDAPFEYPWLGCSGITEGDGLLDSLEGMTDLRGEGLLRFVSGRCEWEYLEDNGSKRLTDREAVERLRAACRSGEVRDIGGWADEKRDAVVTEALKAGISIRQLSRLTGIGKAVIERIARR